MYQNFIVEPLYNALIFILNTVPFIDLGVAVIILTVIVRAILFPISRNAIRSQLKMKEIAPKIKELQTKYKDDRQTMALEMMKIYKDNNIKPFASILLILIQLPIIFALYFVFLREGLPNINFDILYSFITAPSSIDVTFLNLIDLTAKSALLAFTAAFSQFIQAHIMVASQKSAVATPAEAGSKEKMMEDIMKGMNVQMKYVLPVVMYFISYSLGAVIALYFTTSNIFSALQELYLRRERANQTK